LASICRIRSRVAVAAGEEEEEEGGEGFFMPLFSVVR
jgi:hypothetical protein